MTSHIISIFAYSICSIMVLSVAFPFLTSLACGTLAGFFLAILNDIYQLLKVKFGNCS